MSWEKFNDNCAGCRPVILDVVTKKPLPDNHPAVVTMNRVWAGTSLQEREAFHRVTCLNSRDALDLYLMGQITRRFEQASV